MQKRGKVEEHVDTVGGKKRTGLLSPLHGNGIESDTQPVLEREMAADHAHLGAESGTELLGEHLLISLTRQQPSNPHQ